MRRRQSRLRRGVEALYDLRGARYDASAMEARVVEEITGFVKTARRQTTDDLKRRYTNPFLLQRDRFPVHRVRPKDDEHIQGEMTLTVDVSEFNKVLRQISDPNMPRRVFELDAGELTIGRDPECAICIPHFSVSGRHATLRRAGRAYVVVDHHAKNGTYVQERRIAPEAPHPIADKDILAFASLRFQYFEPPSFLELVEQMISKMGGR